MRTLRIQPDSNTVRTSYRMSVTVAAAVCGAYSNRAKNFLFLPFLLVAVFAFGGVNRGGRGSGY